MKFWLAWVGLAAWALAAPAAAEEEKVSFVIPTVSFTFTSAYVAEDLGFFKKEGLEVKMLQILGIGALNAVISGSADFTDITGGSVTRAVAKGQKLLAIANTVDHPMIEMVIRKDIAVAGGFDAKAPLEKRGLILRGHSFSAGGVNSILHGFLKIVARRAGLDPDHDVQMAPMEASNVFPSFQRKLIDGFVLSQPWTVEAVRDGNAVVVASSSAGDLPELVPFGYNLLVTRPEVCAKRRSVCEKMGRVMVDAVTFIRDHPDETIAVLKKRFPNVDADLVASSFAMIRAATPVPPAANRAGLENADVYNVEAGLLAPGDKLKSYDGLFTDEFVR